MPDPLHNLCDDPNDIAAENARLHEELAETRRLLSEVQAAFAELGKRFNRLAVAYSKLLEQSMEN